MAPSTFLVAGRLNFSSSEKTFRAAHSHINQSSKNLPFQRFLSLMKIPRYSRLLSLEVPDLLYCCLFILSVTRAKNPKSAAYLPKIATFIAPIFKVHFFRPNSRPTNKCLFFMQSLAILWHFITWIVWYSNHLPISLRKLDGIWKKKYFSKILK